MYEYDANGARTAARTYNNSDTLLYSESTPRDERGRIEYKDTGSGRLDYTYYANSLLKDVVSSNSGGVNIGYRYDDLNRLAHVDDASTGTTLTSDYTYNANGSLASLTQPNGIEHAYSYDTLNRLRTLDVKVGTVVPNGPPAGTVVHTYEYKLNPSGHRHQAIEGAKTTTYTYDDLYRLTAEAVAGVADPSQNGTVGYTLDKVGNRQARNSGVAALASQLNQTYNARDWLSGDTYDANGSTITSSRFSALNPQLSGTDTYDFEERLIVRTRADGSTINISYDADGNRIAKNILDSAGAAVSSTTWLVDTNNLTGYAQVLEERSSTVSPASSVTRTYTYGTQLLSQSAVTGSSTPVTRYYAFDGHGNVRELTDGTGAVTDTYTYDAFGNLLAHTGTTQNAYLYCGEQFDGDLGLYYNRARYLNTDSGRFWSQDSYIGRVVDPASLHKYLYAGGNPVSGLDPTGNWTLLEVTQTLFVKGITLAIAYPRIAFAVSVAFAATNLAMFVSDEEYRATLIAASPPDVALDIVAADSAFLFNTGANLFRGTFNLATRATQLGLSIAFRDPQSIKYLQAEISPTFRNGGGVEMLANQLRSRQIDPNSVEPIRVFRTSEGEVYTLDHRRLYAYKKANVPVPTVEVAPESVANEIRRKSDAGADGESIVVRGSH